jgi:hypothetical protein
MLLSHNIYTYFCGNIQVQLLCECQLHWCVAAIRLRNANPGTLGAVKRGQWPPDPAPAS